MSFTRQSLSQAERVAWLRLIRSENVGPVTFHNLLQRFGGASQALDALPDMARRGGAKRKLRICSQRAAEDELQALKRLGGKAIAACEAEYPVALAALNDAPPLLFTLGSGALLQQPCVAIVGARNASANGRNFTRRMAGELGEAGLVICSGLARGIDTYAHLGALQTGTVAVVAGGVDIVYPAENKELYQQIVNEGLVVSEVALATQPQARHFPRRNRLISGLSLGVLVVEATIRSGSLITARFAADQGREVFAVPGHPADSRARGPNQLLRQGATLVETAQDVLQTLRPIMAAPAREFEPEPAFEAPLQSVTETDVAQGRTLILDLLSTSAGDVNELVRQSKLTPAVVLTILLELELAGRLERYPGNRVALRLNDS